MQISPKFSMFHPTTEQSSYLSLRDFLPKSMTQFANHNYILIHTNYEILLYNET